MSDDKDGSPARVHPLVRRLPRDTVQRATKNVEDLLSAGLTSAAGAKALAKELRGTPTAATSVVPEGRREEVAAILCELEELGLDHADLTELLDILKVAKGKEEEPCGGETYEFHDDEDKAFEGDYTVADCSLCSEMIATESFTPHWANGNEPPGAAPKPPGSVANAPLSPLRPTRSADGGLTAQSCETGRLSPGSHVIETSTVQKGADAQGNKTINEYAVLRDLGRGAYGKVKLVVHLETGTHAAIKILNKSVLAKVKKGGSGDMIGTTALDDVLQEIAIMKRLNHPNIIRLFEVIDDPECNKMYIIMDLAPNGPLFSLDKDEPLEPERVRYLAVGICQGLDYLHLHGIIHRDIKPDNILLDADNEPRLTDFGVSQSGLDADVDDTQGTPAFLTPEQISVQKVPGKMTDLWALGVTLFIISTGKLPFTGETMQELSSAIRDTEPDYGTIPDSQQEDLIRGLLRKDRCTRIGTKDGVRDCLSHPYLASCPQAALQDYMIDTKVTDEDRKGAVLTGFNIKLSVANAVGVMMKVRGAAMGFRGVLSKGSPQSPGSDQMALIVTPSGGADPPRVNSLADAGRLDDDTNVRSLTSVEQALGGAALTDETAVEEGSSDEEEESVPGSTCSSRQHLTRSQLPATGVYKKQWFTFSRTRSFRTEEQCLLEEAKDGDLTSTLKEAAMEGLKEINLTGFKFEYFPEQALARCVSVETLIAQGCGIKEVPAKIADLSSLTNVNLGRNEIHGLPSSVSRLSNLVQLNLSHNELSSLPDSMSSLQSLTTINLDYNKFDHVPDCLARITGLRKVFMVSNIRLRAFPRALAAWKGCELAVNNSPALMKSWQKLHAVLPGVTVLWDKIYPDAVTEHVFLGSLRTTQNARVLQELGITRILTTGKLLKVIDPLPEGVEQLIISVDDNPDQKLVPFFDQCTAWLEECVAHGRRVLVHCFMGLSRSVTVVCAWLMRIRGMTFKESITFIKRSRPAVNPNQGFRRQLIEYEEMLHGTRLPPDDIENHPNGPTVDPDPLKKEADASADDSAPAAAAADT